MTDNLSKYLDGEAIERGIRYLETGRHDRPKSPVNGTAKPVNGGKFFADAVLSKASEIKPASINWLWREWLSAGKLHILAGEAGTGKTTIALSLAATVSSGGLWPDGTRAQAGNVVIWSGEDSAADTLVPRLIAAGANRDRVFFVQGIEEYSGKRAFNPAKDIEPLRRKLLEIGNVSLIIVDPIVAAIIGDSHKNAEVRQGLQPLADLAEELQATVFGITHFTKGTQGKNPTERVTGSLAFAAAARVVMVAAKVKNTPEGEPSRIFCRSKSNIGRDDGGFGYDLTQGELPGYQGIEASSVAWREPIEGTARELLSEADGEAKEEHGALKDGKDFLRDLLVENSLPVKEVEEEAREAGISWATVRRAKEALGVVSLKTGTPPRWEWVLPNNEKHEYAKCRQGAQDAHVWDVERLDQDAQHKKVEHLEHLQAGVRLAGDGDLSTLLLDSEQVEHLAQNYVEVIL